MLMAANWEEIEKFPKGKRFVEQEGLTREAFPLLDNLDHVHSRLQKDTFVRTNYCLVADLARSTGAVHPVHIRDALEKLISNTKALIYNGELVAILPMDSKMLLPEEIDLINQTGYMYSHTQNHCRSIIIRQTHHCSSFEKMK